MVAWLKAYCDRDSIDGFRHGFMLPDPNDRPTGRPELLIRVSVAKYVGVKLLAPPLVVGFRGGAMLRASVPEASVDEDRYA